MAFALLRQQDLPLLQLAALLLQEQTDVALVATGAAGAQSAASPALTSMLLSRETPSLYSFSSFVFSAANSTILRARYTLSIVSVAFSCRQRSQSEGGSRSVPVESDDLELLQLERLRNQFAHLH